MLHCIGYLITRISVVYHILIGNISVHPIGYCLHTISNVYDIVGLVYDILCDFLCFLTPARADSNAAPLRLKSCPDPVQMRPCSNPMRPLFVPYVCLSSLASKSGCSGLLVHTRRRGHRFRPPPSPPARGAVRERRPPEGAVLQPGQPPPLPPPPPLVIRRWKEPGGCAGRACAARACDSGAGIAGHLRICSQMHMQHRLCAELPSLAAP